MKLRALTIMLVMAATLRPAEPPHPPAPRPRLTPELRQRATEISRAGGAEVAANDDVVTLEPVVINQLYRGKPREEVPTNHPFTFRDGGTFVRREGRHFTTAVKFQASPNGSGFDILSFSW